MNKISKTLLSVYIFWIASLHAYGLDTILSTPDEHAKFIRLSLETARERVVIVSPFITSWRLTNNLYNDNDGLNNPIRAAISRGVNITVFTDAAFDKDKGYATEGRELLASLGVDLKIVSRLHSKNLIIDNDCITFGSFNWLSAETNPNGRYCNYETTTILRNAHAGEVIAKIMTELISLIVQEHKGSYSSYLLDLAISVKYTI